MCTANHRSREPVDVRCSNAKLYRIIIEWNRLSITIIDRRFIVLSLTTLSEAGGRSRSSSSPCDSLVVVEASPYSSTPLCLAVSGALVRAVVASNVCVVRRTNGLGRWGLVTGSTHCKQRLRHLLPVVILDTPHYSTWGWLQNTKKYSVWVTFWLYHGFTLTFGCMPRNLPIFVTSQFPASTYRCTASQ